MKPEMITSRENTAIKEYLKLASDGAARRKSGRFVLEGVRLAKDALLSGVKIERAFLTAQAAEKNQPLASDLENSGVQVVLISNELAAKMADTSSPQGLLCTAFMLDNRFVLDKIDICGVYLALENLQDPGNMGTILRTAEALGVEGVFLSKGCVDIYSPKVIRAAMGAVFRLRIMQTDNLPGVIGELGEKGLTTFAAVARSGAAAITEIPMGRGVLAAVGNEGNGLTEECIGACSLPVTIPMRGRAESLNAASAAAILLWELTKGR